MAIRFSEIMSFLESDNKREADALRYARGLFNLSTEQDTVATEATVDLLRKLHRLYPDNAEIALEYANGLVNRSIGQNAVVAEATIDQLRNLHQCYSDNAEIALAYARGLVNLSAKQDAVATKATIDKLQDLLHHYPDNAEIALRYANGLVNLSAKQDAVAAKATIDQLRELFEHYLDIAEIALAYAKGLFNLSTEQDAVAAKATIDKLQDLLHHYPDNAEIALRFSKGLVNLSAKQDAVAAKATIDQLRELVEHYPDIAEIVLEYAKGLIHAEGRVNLFRSCLKTNDMPSRIPQFKIGITFSGQYRSKYVEPFCNELLNLGYDKDDIFYDAWHEPLINGVHGDSKLREIYFEGCDCVVVLLSPDYSERNWTGHIEWSAVKELINTGNDDKICLLRVDSVDIRSIDGLYSYQAIAKAIDNMDAHDIAKFIDQKYRHLRQGGNP